MNKKYSISFIIPVYKSEKTIASVVGEINKIDDLDWEAIIINDDSPDKVDVIIKKLMLKYPKKIVYLQFRKNYGQHVAIIEGFKHVSKKYVATIDDDGQNPPSEILKMVVKMLENDYDVVYGSLKENKHSFSRKLISKINRLISEITINNKNKVPISNVRLIKNDIAASIASTSSDYSYIEGLIFSLTNHIGCVEIDHKKRISGKSSYDLVKLVKLWMNHVIGYSNIFIKIISLISFSISISTFLVGLIYLFLTINESGRPSGWLSTYLTMTFLFSTLFLILGILTEYIGRIYVKLNQNSRKIVIKKTYAQNN